MKYLKKTIIFSLIISILCITFHSVYIPVYASEHGGGGSTNHGQLTEEEKRIKKMEIVDNIEKYLLFLCSEIGVYFSGSGYSDFYKNYVDYVKSTNDKWFENNISVSDDGNAVFSETLMASLKAYIDKYLKTEQTKEENGGFFLLPTTKYIDVPANSFSNSFQYQTFRNIVLEKGLLSVKVGNVTFTDPFSDPDHPIYLVADATSLDNFKKNPDSRLSFDFFCAYDWINEKQKVMEFSEDNKVYTSCSEAVHVYRGTSSLSSGGGVNNKDINRLNFSLYSSTGETVRVFVSRDAAKNYSVGKRKVYITNNYYDYEPEDLTVSIDDLQKSVDDLQKIIDELLKRVTDKTSEKEIMELLRLILEELRKNPGTGGGSGSGSGDVTVSVDLSTTNNWLSKIYDKVSQISDKLSSSASQSMSEVVESIENLQNMLKNYLSEITGDLDDIKGQLEDMTEQEFTEKTGSFLDETLDSFSEVSEKAKGKFPFSIPNDIRLLITKMTVSQPEDHGPGIYSMQTVSYAAAHESNGLVSVMDEGGGDVPVLSETGAPIFYLPFVIASAGIEQYVVIDLSGFESISKFCRGLMTIWFILCLYNLTFKVMGLWGDLVD